MSAGARVALVTGGSGGLGARICGRLAADGFAVAVGCRQPDKRVDDVVADCTGYGVRSLAVAADLATPGGVGVLIDHFDAAFDRLDVLVNAAGVYAEAPVAAYRQATVSELLAVNTVAVLGLLGHAATAMSRGGSVITLSSLDSVLCAPHTAVYAASKAAVEALTRSAARELGARDITVNAILPGPVDSPLLHANFAAPVRDRMTARVPLRRLGTPDDIASAVSWLAGPGSRWVTGQAIRVDGGVG